MSHSNQSIVIHAAGDLRVEARDVLEPGLGEILVKMQAGGICGSDLHYYQNGGFGPIKLREPMVLGHEVSGKVAALGAGVKNIKIGQLVGETATNWPILMFLWLRWVLASKTSRLASWLQSLLPDHVSHVLIV